MATPADERLRELLDKWLGSLDLHRKYTALDAVSYAGVQPWPPHQRPSPWIIDLARDKVLGLQAELRGRVSAGDGGFSDALEAMIFLANLVGAQHIERFIPLAEAGRETAAVVPQPAPPDMLPPQAPARGAAPAQTAGTAAAAGISDAAREQVMADAERLMQWGRKWYEVAELIARMADRPALPEVRRILKGNKKFIDERLHQPKG